MKIKIKDLEFIIKKIFFSQRYLLKKRLVRAINNNYEKELALIDRFSDKSKNALDIGVYRGVYSLKLSQNFKQIHAFEPNPLLFPYLNDNLKKIIKNINLYNLALSDKSGETELKLPVRSNSIFKDNIEELYQLGAASVHPENEFEKFEKIQVKVEKLDNILIENIGFIKIDVEGHELEVIEGANETIIKNKPVLLVELEKRHSKKPVEDTIGTINNLEYDCYFVEDNKLIPVEKLNNKNLENNFFFLPK